MLGNLISPGLPARIKLVHEHDEVRISHRNGNSAHNSISSTHGKLATHLGLAHVGAKFEVKSIAGSQFAGFQSCAGANNKRVTSVFGAKPSRYAPGTVSRNLGFRAIRVNKANRNVSVTCRQ